MVDVPPTSILGGRACFALVDGVSINLSIVDRWTLPDVDRYITECIALGTRTKTIASVSHYMGEIPGPAARKRIVELVEKHRIDMNTRKVLLADSALMRGVATAWSWLTNDEIVAVAPRQLRQALTWAVAGSQADVDRIMRAAIQGYRILGRDPPVR